MGRDAEITVLYVAREPDGAARTATRLEREDERFAVEMATDASEGVARLDDGVDCIVSDYDMPDQNGVEFLEQVRATRPELPFVLFTADGSEAVASAAISAGVTDYVRRGESGGYGVLADRIAAAVDGTRSAPPADPGQERHPELVADALDTHQDIFYVADTDGTLWEWNARVGEVTGLADADLQGVDVPDLFAETDRDRVSAALGETRQTGEARVEAALRTADGGCIPYELVTTRLTDGDGELTGVAGIGRNVTDAREYERRIEERQERTHDLMHTSTRQETAQVAVETAHEVLGAQLSGFHLLGADGERLEPAAFVDTVREELDEPLAYERESDGDPASEVVWETFESGEPLVIDDVGEYGRLAETTPTRSGIIHPLDEYGVFIVSSTEPHAFDDTDEALVEIVAGSLTTALERVERETELREREAELERQNERLEEFASVVSHDLRNPLNVARGRTELALEDCDTDHLEHVTRAHDRMESLIEDVLTLAREGTQATDPRPVALGEIARQCWQTVETGNATLAVETDATVRADRSQLQQLLGNLVRNSVEHGSTAGTADADGDGSNRPDRPALTVTIGDLDDGFYVEDDGVGIPAAEREQVTEVGYSTSPDGTGFGLTIVERIADAHGWTVTITEGAEGGARFEFTGVETDPPGSPGEDGGTPSGRRT